MTPWPNARPTTHAERRTNRQQQASVRRYMDWVVGAAVKRPIDTRSTT